VADDCVGSECTVTEFGITNITAKTWKSTDVSGKQIEGEIKPKPPTGKDSWEGMRDFFKKSLEDHYKPNPKLSKCPGDGECVCKKDDAPRVVRGPNTDNHEWEVEYIDPSGHSWMLTGTYTLTISVYAGTCRPPKKTKPKGRLFYIAIAEPVIPPELTTLVSGG
jgi:hypothetical protein